VDFEVRVTLFFFRSCPLFLVFPLFQIV
jgi:hypothetical protein